MLSLHCLWRFTASTWSSASSKCLAHVRGCCYLLCPETVSATGGSVQYFHRGICNCILQLAAATLRCWNFIFTLLLSVKLRKVMTFRHETTSDVWGYLLWRRAPQVLNQVVHHLPPWRRPWASPLWKELKVQEDERPAEKLCIEEVWLSSLVFVR